MLSAKRLWAPLLTCLMLQLQPGHAQQAPAHRTAAAPAAAGPSMHEQQLTAIRQALLEASLDAPTQVVSTSWIDHMGALREQHQYNTRAEVRGIRLFTLGGDDAAAGRPAASAEVLPWGWRRDGAGQASCAEAPRPWRMPLGIAASLGAVFPGEQRAPGQALLLQVERQAQAVLQHSARWTPIDQTLRGLNTYLQALTAPPKEEAGWQLEIELFPDAGPSGTGQHLQAQATSAGWLPAPPWVWTLRLSLKNTATHPAQAGSLWQQSWRIPVDVENLAEHPTRWRAPIEAEVTRRLGVWLHGVEAQLRCEPTPFVVRHDGAGLTLMAGRQSGLRSGDRVLIMQPGWVPGRLLDPRVADHLALAEVVQSGPRSTQIRQLAGPPLPPGNDWVALPL